MKVIGTRRHRRKIELDGKRIFLDEKSYDGGWVAAYDGKDVQEAISLTTDESRTWACPMSFSAGYAEGIESIALQIEEQQKFPGFV